MSYLKIANKGEIEKEALTLLGGTTKRGDSSKIGMFGSGNKYALAYLLRNEFNVKIYSGETEINISTVEKSFRDNKYDVITIDGMETSITTESGPQWEFWHAIREIYSNALDEGLVEMNETPEVMPFKDETHFYLEWNDEVKDFFENIHKYFSKKRLVYNTNEAGKCFKPIKEKELIVYRKGIRCHIGEELCLFHYDFENISITESRVISSRTQMVEMIHNFIFKTQDDHIIDQFYATTTNTNFVEQNSPGMFREPSHALLSDKWMERMPAKYLATNVHLLLMSEREAKDCHVVQPWFFDVMRKKFGDKIVPPFFREKKTTGQFEFRDLEPTEKIRAYLKIVHEFFKEVGYDFDRNIRIVKFNNNKTISTDKGDILLCESIFDQGRSHLIMQVLMLDIQIEAQEKEIPTNTHTASKFVSYMAQQNSYLF